MQRYTNGSGISLSMAAFLAHDGYDYEENTVSATKLLKPIRQLILASRVPEADSIIDVSGLVKSRMGSAIHDAIERVWTNHKDEALSALGIPEPVIKRVRVNPDPDTVTEEEIPVYLELRSYKEVMGYTVSGKFDFVGDGTVEDFKFTGTFTYTNGTKDRDYQLQGSLYRWLNPKIITGDVIKVNMTFWDFQPFRAKTDPNYPPAQTITKEIPLLSVEETERFVRNKLKQIQKYEHAPQEDLPLCTDEELWRKAPVWKYYKNPEKTARATKNFDNKQEAYTRLAKDGGKGLVVEQGGEVVACKYCPAFPICTQKDDLIADGSLKV